MSAARQRGRPIVASAHLVSEQATELSELEFGLVTATNAFNRWIVRCMAAAGCPDLSALDVQVLHQVNHRGRRKKLADLCLLLNIEDSHTVTYALRKLARLGLIDGEKSGKEMLYATTEAGEAACERYRQVREDCLISALEAFAPAGAKELNVQAGNAANLLRAISGLYDQAARAATSL